MAYGTRSFNAAFTRNNNNNNNNNIKQFDKENFVELQTKVLPGLEAIFVKTKTAIRRFSY